MCLNCGCDAEPSKVERIEEASQALRGTIAEDLATDSPTFDGARFIAPRRAAHQTSRRSHAGPHR